MGMSKTAVATLAMILSTAMWGFSGFFSRNLVAEGFTTMQVAFSRNFVSFVILTVVFLIIDRGCFKVSPRNLVFFALIAVFKVLSDMFLFLAQTMIPLSLSTVLQMTSPYWVLLFSVFMFGEAVTIRKVFAVCLAFLGCVLLSGVVEGGSDIGLLGVLYGALAGLAYAIYFVGTKYSMNEGASANSTLYFVFLLSAVMCIPFSDMGGYWSNIKDLECVGNILGMGIIITLLPYYLQIFALMYLSPVKCQVMGVLEVAFATLVGLAIYGEVLDLLEVIGLILIPLSIIILNVGHPGSDGKKDPDIGN